MPGLSDLRKGIQISFVTQCNSQNNENPNPFLPAVSIVLHQSLATLETVRGEKKMKELAAKLNSENERIGSKRWL